MGIKLSTSKYVLLLNPDTVIINKKSIGLLRKQIIKKNTSVVGGSIIDGNNQNQLTATGNIDFLTGLFEFTNLKKIFPNNKFSNNFWLQTTNTCTKVSSLCGAYLMFKKITNNKLNLFDESFFLYLEDVDFGLKNTKEGMDVVYCPEPQILHLGGKSSSGTYNIELKHWYNSRKVLFKKNLPKHQYTLIHFIFNFEEKLLRLYHFLKNEPAY